MSDRWPFRCSTGKSLMTSKAARDSLAQARMSCVRVWLRTVYLAPYTHTFDLQESRIHLHCEASRQQALSSYTNIIVIIELNRFYIASKMFYFIYTHIYESIRSQPRYTIIIIIIYSQTTICLRFIATERPSPHTRTYSHKCWILNHAEFARMPKIAISNARNIKKNDFFINIRVHKMMCDFGFKGLTGHTRVVRAQNRKSEIVLCSNYNWNNHHPHFLSPHTHTHSIYGWIQCAIQLCRILSKRK